MTMFFRRKHEEDTACRRSFHFHQPRVHHLAVPVGVSMLFERIVTAGVLVWWFVIVYWGFTLWLDS